MSFLAKEASITVIGIISKAGVMFYSPLTPGKIPPTRKSLGFMGLIQTKSHYNVVKSSRF